MKTYYKNLGVEIKEVIEDDFTIRAVFSTGDIDRHGERVDQKSWKLDAYLQNPVVLFAHKHDEPAIGRVNEIGYNADGNLEGVVQFAAKEYEFANTIFNLYKGGYMRAFSVGFTAGDVEVDDEDQVILKDNELFELSTVNVPANALALAKSKGVDVSPYEDYLKTRHIEKEGRVLSASNRARIEKARDALNELLQADEKGLEDNQSANKAKEEVAQNTPVAKGGVKKIEKENLERIFNKAVRSLIKEKRALR